MVGNIQFMREIQTGLWVSTFKQALTKTIKDKHKGNTGRSLHPPGRKSYCSIFTYSTFMLRKNMLLKKKHGL